MKKEQWIKVAETDDLKDRIPIKIEIDEEQILLVRLDGKIYALSNACPHYGAPLNEGHICDHEIVCPWHNARFNLKNGQMTAPPALDDILLYPVRVEDGDILLGKAEEPEIPTPSGTDDRTFLILGAGAAGNTAAETLRRKGFAGQIKMLTSENERPYDRPNLSKLYMSGEAPASWIPLRSKQFYPQHNIELLTNHKVAKLDPKSSTVTTYSGKSVTYDKCFLATGGRPRKLNLIDDSLENVFYLRSFQDAQKITSYLENINVVVVLGGGFIGTEVAASLRERGMKVHLVAPEKIPMENIFGPQVGKRIRILHKENGTTLHMNTTIKRVKGRNKVHGVILSDGNTLSVDMIIAGLGIEPALNYLKDTNLVQENAVPVDSHLQTKFDNIYAAGDIAAVPDPNTGERNRAEHWVVAERQGQHAARAMLGNDKPYSEVPFFWTRQFGVSLKSVGFAGQFDQIASHGNIENGDFIAGYYQKGKLKAATTMGMSDELFKIEKLLKDDKSIAYNNFKDYDFN